MNQRDQVMQGIIAEGLAINAAHGTARAWVYMLHSGISRDTVAAVLGEAARLASARRRTTGTLKHQQEVYAADVDV